MLLLFKISFTALFATDRTHPDSVLWCWSCQLMLHLYKRREHDRRICFLYCLCVAVLTRVSFTAFLFFLGMTYSGKSIVQFRKHVSQSLLLALLLWPKCANPDKNLCLHCLILWVVINSKTIFSNWANALWAHFNFIICCR